MAARTKLYRLLRDDENPLDEGIKAKLPNEDKTPLQHIRHGSRHNSQWISTSRNLSDVDELIRFKRRKEGRSRRCRVVEIDEQRLKLYAEKNRDNMRQLLNLMMKMTVKEQRIMWKLFTQLLEETTGKIFDFTDQTVMNEHIPKDPFSLSENEKARGYARRYSEVLVERFIPADCCIRICDR
ncbi:uncharacterized protein LOC128545836 [Mercenaria mercenaria]|uniref:uncharacterized protein LOC128545836 n=1 Tax=Mercenaria mercenaria TaxID=6596 RepID=UPI00234E5307|nr:uncharacterized protein LOC128545836 [Mercenaria mercenaria]